MYSQSRSSSHAAEEAGDLDIHEISSNVSSVNISKASKSNSGALDICVEILALEVDTMRLISDNHPTITSFPSTPSLDEKPSLKKDESSTKDAALENHASFKGTLQPGSVWVLICIIIVFDFILEVLI